MNSTPHTDAARTEAENRQLIMALRAEIDVLRGTQTATNAVMHAVLATHGEPHHAQTAVAHIVEQLTRQSAGWPETSRRAMDSTIAALRTTLDNNLKNREAHKARAAG